MSKLRTFLMLACLAALSTAMAAPVSENEAMNIASQFLAQKSIQASGLKMAHKALLPSLTKGAETAAYYVFNADRSLGGYVVVAGDDRAPAVLGYSDTGKFDDKDMPEAMQELLDSYVEQINAIDDGQAALHFTANRAIAPLVPAVWSQNTPYNKLLPYLQANKHAYAGCVATALAQIMYYYKWPATSMAIPGYTSQTLKFVMPELPSTDFEWDLMRNTYQTTDTTSAAALAAAKLTLYCAQALQANFKNASTSASSSDIPEVISTYFGYKGTAKYYRRPLYTTPEWEAMIYAELETGRPIVYAGSKISGAHAFVLDGCDGNGMFHINWGWNGQSNGYFLLSVLNPDIQGTGSADGAYGYVLSQAFVGGIEPGEAMDESFCVTSKLLQIDEYINTRNSTDEDFSLSITTHFANYTNHPISFDFGWGVYQEDGTLVTILNKGYRNDLSSGYYIYPSRTLLFGSGITSGTYRIVPVCSEREANNWRPCEAASLNYIEMVIDGNDCTFTCCGVNGTPFYTLNSCQSEGLRHPNRPLDITLNLTNLGTTRNDVIYMLVNDEIYSASFIDIARGESGDIQFRFVPTAAGEYNLTFSAYSDGRDPFALYNVLIEEMPAANLSGSIMMLNVTDATNKIMTSDKYSVQVNITNNGSTPYHEDISLKMYKYTQGSSGSNVQSKNQLVYIEPGETISIQFDMENVIDGWRYFSNAYYYSAGTQVKLAGSSFYTIVFPEVPEFILGDVNDDQVVDVDDVTLLIGHILNGATINELAADMNDDHAIDIDDVTLLIQRILGN